MELTIILEDVHARDSCPCFGEMLSCRYDDEYIPVWDNEKQVYTRPAMCIKDNLLE